jgi:peptidyl-prolyl cis-trans isomerase D
MLQRIRDSLGKFVIVVVLGLIAFTFIFWGVSDFTGVTGGSTFAAKVNGEDIPLTDFDRELSARQRQFQMLYRSELPEDLRRELRRAVIEDLVREEALRQRVEEQGYRASDVRVAQSIREITAFHAGGEFNYDVYRGQLQNAGLTPTMFEELQRRSLELGDLQRGIADSTFLTPAEFRRYIELFNERRELAYALFRPEAFADGIEIDEAAIVERYENNQAAYQTDETVDIEYIELALADFAASVEVSEEDLLVAYERERERFEMAEERRASHILIEVGDGNEDAARAAAESALARIRGGEDFAAVAAEVSDDAGTKAQGGDLGWLGRDTFPGAFGDALFSLEPGQVSEPVRTEFGFHLIRLDEVRAAEIQPFEEVREQLAAELRTRLAEDAFFDRVDDLTDAAFNADDELASVADALNLPLKTLEGFPRTGDDTVFPNSAPVVQAAFDEDIVDSGRNSDVVQLAEDHVLVLRVTDHHLPVTKPLDEVREQIREELVRERAEQLADEAADAFLADLEQGRDPVEAAAERRGEWHAAQWVMRTDATAPTEVLTAAFGMPKTATATAPLRDAVALVSGGQAVVVVTGVEAGRPETLSAEEREQRRQQLADQAARAELTSYAGNVRDSARVRIPDSVLNPPLF